MKIMDYIKKSSLIFIIMVVITGIVYPLMVTGISQALMHNKANGSIITDKENRNIGAKNIGQSFTDPGHFWSRPSVAGDGYDVLYSAGTNISPASKEFKDLLDKRVAQLKEFDPENTQKIPVDLITASGSGLDPHISLAAAKYQVSRVSKYTNIPEDKLLELIKKHTDTPFLGLFGETKLNALALNLDLDKLK